MIGDPNHCPARARLDAQAGEQGMTDEPTRSVTAANDEKV